APDDEGAHGRAPAQPLRDDLRANIEPDDAAAAEEAPAVARVDDRAAARRDDAGQRRSGVDGPESLDRGALSLAETGLALRREHVRDPRAGLALDQCIQVDEGRAVSRGDALAHGRLATPRQPDDDKLHLNRPHRSRPSRRPVRTLPTRPPRRVPPRPSAPAAWRAAPASAPSSPSPRPWSRRPSSPARISRA